MTTVGALAYSSTNPEHRLEIEETKDGPRLLVKGETTHGETATIGITLSGEDLVRALLTASPSVVDAIGGIAKNMILSVLANQELPHADDLPPYVEFEGNEE